MVTLPIIHQKLRKMYDDELEYQFEQRELLDGTYGRKLTPELIRYQNMLTGLINNSCRRAQNLDEIITDQQANQEAA